ncbi:pirin family protein [Segetibacter sp. 3557_3]|uniref:pirin family protein n=1 Tax=Segetibacter sp. 3557_3 TaxID=2547429 RepID=UPI0010584630|nr:pirin family protein [Segetibacter sp. 3557_3]TDH23994.1 pirin family protein [Segetibacter sp. 3557_3]
MQKALFPAADRGQKDIGWLLSKFTFSFSSYRNPTRNGFGLLKAFNDDRVEAGRGFGLHPHGNMEIISIMLQGKMSHKDSMGYNEVVEKDGVQIMSAGSGLRHEEYNVGDDDVKFLQIWIEPKLQNISPRYQRRSFPRENRINKLQTVVSNEEGAEHCWINQNAKLSLGYFEGGQTANYVLNPTNKCVFVFVTEGEVAIDGERLLQGDGLGIWEADQFDIRTEGGAQFIVVEVPVNH